ncbi:MAG: hypothetical protein WAL98_11795 [Desulfatiglandaceae bacterium]
MDIHRESFIFGMITAFAECLANESKRAAFSPPFYPEDYPIIRAEAERIAEEQCISLWYENNHDIPSSKRIVWFVMFKYPEVLDEYRRIRNEGHNPAWDLEPFSSLLSYGNVWGRGAEKVTPAMREKISGKVMPTVSRVLFKNGGWPPERP